MHWEIHPPRPSRLPSGFALGQSLGPRGAKSPPSGNLLGLGGCISQYIPPLGSVRIQYTIQQISVALHATYRSYSYNPPKANIVLDNICTSCMTQHVRYNIQYNGLVLPCALNHKPPAPPGQLAFGQHTIQHTCLASTNPPKPHLAVGQHTFV